MNEKLKSNRNLLTRIFLGLSSFQILAMFRRGLFYTFLSLYLRFFLHLSVTATTLYGTVPMVLSVIGQNFVWGPLSDKIQKRRIFIVVGELFAGFGLIIIWAIHLLFSNLQYAGYFVIGGLSIIEFFWSMSNISWSSLVSDVYSPKKRSRVIGGLTSLGGIGQILGIFIGGILYDGNGLKYEGFGFREGILFIIAAAIMISSIFPILLLIPEGGAKRSWNETEEQELDSENLRKSENRSDFADSDSQNRSVFLYFIIALFVINLGRNSIAIIFSQYLSLSSGIDANSEIISYILNTRSIATILLGLVAGKLSNKIGLRKTLAISSFIAVIYLYIFSQVTKIELIYVGTAIWGFCEVLIGTSSYALASILIPSHKRARLFGWYNASFFLSWGIGSTFIVGPTIDYLLKDGMAADEAYRFAFFISSMITMIGLILFLISVYIERKKGKKYVKHEKNQS